MRVPTIDQLLIDVSAFVSQGEEFARNYPRNELSALIKSAFRLGVDAHAAISDILFDLYSIQRQLKRLRRIWAILFSRCVMIWTGVIFVRVVLLQSLDADAWDVWVRTDRLLLASTSFLTVILMVSLINRYLVRGWGPSSQSRLWANVCHYVTMGREHVYCAQLQQSLKKIAIAEWRTGLSGQSARRFLLKKRVSSLCDEVDQECGALSTVTVGVELSTFALSFTGLNFAPLMAWMESASGVN